MQLFRFDTLRPNAVALALVGILGVSGAAIQLKLPQRIQRGDGGQKAIEMLDAMRRPFLGVRQAEVRLLETGDVQARSRARSLAIASARGVLERYKALARYDVVLSTNVGELSEAFETWVAAERLVFSSVQAASGGKGGGPPTGGFMSDLASAASGFLHTMDVLGAGETPIHADITDGRRATHLVHMLVLTLLLYSIAAALWLQRTTSKREGRLLQEQVRFEREALGLEQVLNRTLAKVLSGFIPICAGCKRIRGDDNQWTQVESYVTKKTDATFNHSICPECETRLYGDFLSLTTGPTSP